jgi:malate synthase
MGGSMVVRAGLSVAGGLAELVEGSILPGTGIDADRFWGGMAAVLHRFAPENRALLAERERMQAAIDQWHRARGAIPIEPEAYQAFLRSIGYLVDDPAPFQIATAAVDSEIAAMAGPQLVVPVLNRRFLVNAVNARWGSLYDALYASDAIPGAAAGPGYDAARGTEVIRRARAFLDTVAPLAGGSHSEVAGYRVADGRLLPALADPALFAGYSGDPAAPDSILLRHHGLHIEIRIDRRHPVGASDPAGVCDIQLEAALTAIVDFEDSTAAVDADDKVAVYANWLALMQDRMTARFERDGRTVERVPARDRTFTAADGGATTLSGRSLLLVRNVGLLMDTDAVLLDDGSPAPEGIVDALVSVAAALHDRTARRNSRHGSVYVVKPKLHGPAECAFVDRLFAAVEATLGLPRHTVKIGVMDEERRTSANLAACIAALRDRIFFINTGFLDRTGDEIHTSIHAGPFVPKGEMADARWLATYEARNVAIGLRCGFSGRAQIGKGMWTAPDRMADMIEKKIAHPRAGANTAWVPSPTAATLHALHYHMVDVFDRQRELAAAPMPGIDGLLDIPLALGRNWKADEIARLLDDNVQSILGYVARWVNMGVGCSKIPNIDDVGLMEDRATLRISAQQLANWVLHRVCTTTDIEAALGRMAMRVDSQNAAEPGWKPLVAGTPAFEAARALILRGATEPSGYTEPLLHQFRRRAKKSAGDSAPTD